MTKIDDVYKEMLSPLGFQKNKGIYYKIENGLIYCASFTKRSKYCTRRYFSIHPLCTYITDYDLRDYNYYRVYETEFFRVNMKTYCGHSYGEPYEPEALCAFLKKELQEKLVPIFTSITSYSTYLDTVIEYWHEYGVDRFVSLMGDPLNNMLLQVGTEEQVYEFRAKDYEFYERMDCNHRNSLDRLWADFDKRWGNRDIDAITAQNNAHIAKYIEKLKLLGFK